jgi:hypothetical protein
LYQDAQRARREKAAAASGAGADRFARLLPYAMALDAVAAWEAGLGDLPQAVSGTAVDPYPHWYYRDPSWYSTSRSPQQWSSFTDDFSATTSRAAAPGSSSGSSSGSSPGSSSSSSDSGGSSGGDGGGGGGGGGGW